MDNKNTPQRANVISLGFNTLLHGLKSFAEDCRWFCSKTVRGFEIKQLRSRLQEEYACLGKALAERVRDAPVAMGQPLPPADGPIELGLKQIAFLKEEIEFLNTELERLGAERQASRKAEREPD
jgi:hypothetical protein